MSGMELKGTNNMVTMKEIFIDDIGWRNPGTSVCVCIVMYII